MPKKTGKASMAAAKHRAKILRHILVISPSRFFGLCPRF
jgi:hypothetical protein